MRSEESDIDDDEPIVSARNPELARQMESMRQEIQTLREEKESMGQEIQSLREQHQETERWVRQAEGIAQNALDFATEKDDRIDELEAENEELRERIATLEGRVTPDPTTKDYDEMSRDERVRQIRVSCARKAVNNGGKAAIDYNNVMTLFDYHPSVGYAYKLLKLAGGLEGFTHETREAANNRLRVDMDAVNDESVFHAVNKDENGGGR